jgi:hypothetical protein
VKLPFTQLDTSTSLQEFDVWITPSLGEIKDTERFQREMGRVVQVFDAMGDATDHFSDPGRCDPASIVTAFTRLVNETDHAPDAILHSLASVLFLVTGKSDNNAKCQFPIYLRDKSGWDSLPAVKLKRGIRTLSSSAIPRVLKAETYMGLVAALGKHPELQEKLLKEFVLFVLSDDTYISQLWSVGRSYFMLKGFGREKDLLAPLVVFQVRGSVAASGGHDPEALLRSRLVEWGLQADVDFNLADAALADLPGLVIPVEGEETTRVRVKTRAYDFVLPFRTPGWRPQVFVQCQFYAGDSGSVSHKNVDQTTTSRLSVVALAPDARFVEYVDGAGYFSSLNGDLKTLLAMGTTRSFFQVRSAAIRLRRELQQIGFLVPLEIEHAVLRTDGSAAQVRQVLVEDGYSDAEVTRGLLDSIERHLVIRAASGELSVLPERRATCRRYLLLDLAAIHGSPPARGSGKPTGSLIVPGYGPFHGMKLDDLMRAATDVAPATRGDWSNPVTVLGDIRWLADEGLAMSA